ncbi:unnamed protein product [Sphagnum balticum]
MNPLAWGAVLGSAAGGICGIATKFITAVEATDNKATEEKAIQDKAWKQWVGAATGSVAGGITGGIIGATMGGPVGGPIGALIGVVGCGSAGVVSGSILGYNAAGVGSDEVFKTD